MLFYLTILFYLIAITGAVAFTPLPVPAAFGAKWNKLFSILAVVVGLLAAIILIFAAFSHPLVSPSWAR